MKMAKIGINIATGSLQQREMIAGIDLGTTNSLVAIIHPESKQPVALKEHGSGSLVPSIIYFDASGHITVGEEAKKHLINDPRNTIFSVKRLMGKSYNDIKERSSFFTYKVIDDNSEKLVKIQVGEKFYTPIELSSYILKELKNRAEHILKTQVTKAVITVPAYFDDAQRQATKDAGRLAGLDVLRLINEPTAAALAYGLEKKRDGLFAVYDLGGGTFDITILVLDNGIFQVRSTGGDSALGGDDMDRALAEMLLERMGVPATSRTPEVVRLALDAARAAKHALTDRDAVELELPAAGGGTRVVTIQRADFEALIKPIVERTGIACRRALKDAGIAPSELDGVILVGGATRVPFVRRYVRDLFGREPLSDIDPDQVVALGAAVQADLLAGSGPRDDVLLLDVVPLSLGLEMMGGVVEKIIHRNTTIPCGAKQTFTTFADNQTGFDLHV